MFKDIYETAAQGRHLNGEQIQRLTQCPAEHLPEMLRYTKKLREQAFGRHAAFCSIINARSGRCGEDCAFCAQSTFYNTDAQEYALLPLESVLDAAKRMRDAGATRFSLVTSGKSLSADEFKRFADMVRELNTLHGLKIDASPGILTKEQLLELKACGLNAYHHNLETARSFFPQICSTHDYDEDVAAVRAAKQIGLYTCVGGIFGLGETWEHRVELAKELKALDVDSVPINFLHPIPGTPMQSRPLLQADEALKIIALYRFLLPTQQIRICGGRETVLGAARKKEVYQAGASGIMIGDYLTVKGAAIDTDRREAADLGLIFPHEGVEQTPPPSSSEK